MSGNRAGGLAAAAKNKARDPQHYAKIALLAQKSWAKNGRKPRGFSLYPELAVEGGKRSRKPNGNLTKLPVTNQAELDELEKALQDEAKVVR